MSVLKERLLEQQNGVAPRGASNLRASNELQEIKARVHRILINKLDLSKLENADPDAVQKDVKKVIERILDDENAPLSGAEREQVQTDVLNELFGLGPLEPLLADKTISDILVNGWRNVYIERRGKLEKVDLTFRDDSHLMQIIDRIVSRVGRRVDESVPMVDARLPDGSRVNAIIPPLSIDGPMLSIRRFGAEPLTIKNLLELKTLTRRSPRCWKRASNRVLTC